MTTKGTAQPVVTLAIRVSTDLYHKLHDASVAKERTMTELVCMALEAFLKK